MQYKAAAVECEEGLVVRLAGETRQRRPLMRVEQAGFAWVVRIARTRVGAGRCSVLRRGDVEDEVSLAVKGTPVSRQSRWARLPSNNSLEVRWRRSTGDGEMGGR